MEHNLATLEKITEIKDIPNADRIQVAKVQGYWSVIKKGEYVPGSWIFFIQPDTKCKRAEWNRFLWPKDDPDPAGKDIRIKVAKFRGQVSYGLIVDTKYLSPQDLVEGADVSEKLGVTKYEKFESDEGAGGNNRGRVSNFPGFLRKTDEPRLQSYMGAFEELKGKKCYATIKYDGSSVTFYLKDGKFGVCSRRQDIEEIEGNKFWYVARKYKIEEYLRKLPYEAAFQAELIGPGTQGNKLQLKDWEIRVFNLFNIQTQYYESYPILHGLCHEFDLPIAKEVWIGQFEFNSVEELEELSKQKYEENGSIAEGIVIRPVSESRSDALNDRLSVKVINPEFAIKYGE
jgi:RNA ligase (TIGR02306 family)